MTNAAEPEIRGLMLSEQLSPRISGSVSSMEFIGWFTLGGRMELLTGKVPGKAASKGETWVFGVVPEASEDVREPIQNASMKDWRVAKDEYNQKIIFFQT